MCDILYSIDSFAIFDIAIKVMLSLFGAFSSITIILRCLTSALLLMPCYVASAVCAYVTCAHLTIHSLRFVLGNKPFEPLKFVADMNCIWLVS